MLCICIWNRRKKGLEMVASQIVVVIRVGQLGMHWVQPGSSPVLKKTLLHVLILSTVCN